MMNFEIGEIVKWELNSKIECKGIYRSLLANNKSEVILTQDGERYTRLKVIVDNNILSR